MNNSDLNTEQIILEAAEAEFLEKGYGNAKTIAIAQRAGVSHSMLHYYYRTKEKLFKIIFQHKIKVLAEIFKGIDEQNLPFDEMVRGFIENQFDFVAQNPKLPRFVLNEIVVKRENLELLLNVVFPVFSENFAKIENILNKAIAEGKVRPIKLQNLVMNIVSMNVAAFVAMPVLEQIFPDIDEKTKQNFLAERRESNVQFILNALRP